MTVTDGQERIEEYLGRLGERLRAISEDDAREIVKELRSHITEKASPSGEVTSAGVEAALSALGTPEELASQYMTDALLARVEVSRSPVRLLQSLFRWASLSLAGFFVLFGSVVGYVLGVALILCALLKPLHPRTAGLWIFPDGANGYIISLRLGFASAPVGGRDVLGWWIVPIGLIVGCGLLVLTTRFATWCARQYRKSRVLPS